MKKGNVLLIIFFSNIIFADICDDWFNKLKIPKDESCVLRCSSSKVNMGTFHCTSECKRLCKNKDESNLKWSISDLAYYPGLNKAEKELVSKSPVNAFKVYIAKEKAERLTEYVFERSDFEDESDAFRHYVWAALITIATDQETATRFLNAHEQSSEQKEASRSMDLANNRLGIIKGDALKKQNKMTLDDITNSALKELKNKNLVINKKQGLPQNKYFPEGK